MGHYAVGVRTVVELPLFTRLVRGRLSEASVVTLTNFIAFNPEAGDLIEGSGGARKLRWAGSGRGKSGGARIVTYWHCAGCPVVMITIYLKNERANLTKAEVATLKNICKELAREHRSEEDETEDGEA